MPFSIAAAGIAAGAGIYAANKQADTAQSAQDAAQAQFQQQRTDVAPWRTTGAQALPATADLLGLNGPDAASAAMGNYQTSPGYQWQLEQGLRAVDAGAAGQGMLRSGATLKAEQEYGQGLANQDFGNYYQRLMGLSTLGANVASGGAANAANAANTSIGGANAQNSITGNTFQGLSSGANTLLNNPNFQDWSKGLVGVSPVSQSVANQNALYQQGAFASQPAGTYGPFS